MSGARAPLADVRVLAIEQYGAGPFGTLHLADLGADVIKIENPDSGGDVGRYVPPHQAGESSLFFETFNRNKRSISLDITSPGGREVFTDLVRASDAVYSNLRGDLPEKLGIRYADLAEYNPRIVCCALTGFGQSGPRRDEAGYDYIVQGITGWMSMTGEPGGPPQRTGFSTVDYSGGLVSVLSLLVGLHAARRDGVGGDCDVSLFDTAFAMIGYPVTWFLHDGVEAERVAQSGHPSLVPFQNFRTADSWIVLACPKEKFFIRLCEALGREDLRADGRFSGFENRRRNRDELVAELQRELSRRTSAEWLEVLAAHGVPSGPVNGIAQAIAEPQTRAREMIVETESPEWGKLRAPASPVRYGPRRTEHEPAPGRGEHTREVCERLLGYDAARFTDLAAGGAFGTGSNRSAEQDHDKPSGRTV